MTLRQFLDRLQSAPFVLNISRQSHDNSIFIECDHGFRDATWSIISANIGEDEPLDDEVARAVCRELRIPPDAVGL